MTTTARALKLRVMEYGVRSYWPSNMASAHALVATILARNGCGMIQARQNDRTWKTTHRFEPWHGMVKEKAHVGIITTASPEGAHTEVEKLQKRLEVSDMTIRGITLGREDITAEEVAKEINRTLDNMDSWEPVDDIDRDDSEGVHP